MSKRTPDTQPAEKPAKPKQPAEKPAKPKDALVIMTRSPEPGHTKTRMMPRLSPAQCAGLHEAFLADLDEVAAELADEMDVFVAYTFEDTDEPLRRCFHAPVTYFEQEGPDLGSRMANIGYHVFDEGYDRCVLMGSDAPEVRPDDVREALNRLDDAQAVIGPTADGGYFLAAFKGDVPPGLFDLKTYGHSSVLEQTLESLASHGVTADALPPTHDLDEWEDAENLLARAEHDDRLAKLHTVSYLRELVDKESPSG